MKSIAVFNNKGGVGKTTLLCNLASYICKEYQMKVLVIDIDPQCNTTTYVLDDETFLDTYGRKNSFTINDIVGPLKRQGAYINQEKIIPLKSEGFYFDIIPGNPELAMNEDFISGDWKDLKASEIRGIRTNMLFFDLLSKCEQYDFVFFDMGPSLGAINRAALLACDYFLTPMASDVFSILALDNIGKSIVEWKERFNTTIDGLSDEDKESINTLKPNSDLCFLGYVVQQYITKTVENKKRVVQAYQRIVKKMPDRIKECLIKQINQDDRGVDFYLLGSIPNFYSLIPMSQNSHKPVFALNSNDGVVGAHYQKVKEYEDIMKSIADHMFNNIGELG